MLASFSDLERAIPAPSDSGICGYDLKKNDSFLVFHLSLVAHGNDKFLFPLLHNYPDAAVVPATTPPHRIELATYFPVDSSTVSVGCKYCSPQ